MERATDVLGLACDLLDGKCAASKRGDMNFGIPQSYGSGGFGQPGTVAMRTVEFPNGERYLVTVTKL